MYQKDFCNGLSGDIITNLNLNEMASNASYAEYASSANAGFAFTPTTLAKFESTFNALNDDLASSASLTSTALKTESAADCLWADMSEYSDSDSEDSNCSVPTTKRSKTSPNSYVEINTSRIDQKTGRKLPGPRPTRNLDNMTPLEAERRQRRRERNKTAAARCRQRRVDVTNELLAETDLLEKEAAKLEREIEALLRQKNQLEFVLDAHKPLCSSAMMTATLPPPTVNKKCIKSEAPLFDGATSQCSSAVRPSSLPISAASNTSNMSGMMESAGSIFSFNTSTSLTGLTPYFSSDLMSPSSSFMLLSPSMLLA